MIVLIDKVGLQESGVATGDVLHESPIYNYIHSHI